MFNPYSLILGLFSIAGFATMILGWRNIQRARKRALWPTADAVIEKVIRANDSPELQSSITVSFTFNGRPYSQSLLLASDEPSPDAKQLVAGQTVKLRINPNDPAHPMFDMAPGKGDWLIIAVGAGAALFGLVALLVNI